MIIIGNYMGYLNIPIKLFIVFYILFLGTCAKDSKTEFSKSIPSLALWKSKQADSTISRNFNDSFKFGLRCYYFSGKKATVASYKVATGILNCYMLTKDSMDSVIDRKVIAFNEKENKEFQKDISKFNLYKLCSIYDVGVLDGYTAIVKISDSQKMNMFSVRSYHFSSKRYYQYQFIRMVAKILEKNGVDILIN